MNKTYYSGLDVHKDTIAITYISSPSWKDAIYLWGLFTEMWKSSA